jgi:imidazoleglycerol phosphate dehydratase HisB
VQASTEQQGLILELQLLDNEIMQSNTKLKSLPEIEQLLHIEKRVTTANDELAVVKSEADQIALELRRGEVDVETVTDRIKKDEARLSSGNATPKELEQLQHEVETLKKRQEALEEIELEIMIRNDAVIARSNTLTTDLASLQTLKDEISGRLQSATDEINKVIALKTRDWNEMATFLCQQRAPVTLSRKTLETDIFVSLNLDGAGNYNHQTGLGFFNHMLDQLAKHSGIDLSVTVSGDLHIDEHHTIEDTALALGAAFKKALGDKRGIERYGFFILPMDDALAQVGIDFSGRPWLVWNASFLREKVGDLPTEMVYHFFKSFSDAAACNINISVSGENEHHKIEALFKSFAKAIKMAVKKDPENHALPSTKGLL